MKNLRTRSINGKKYTETGRGYNNKTAAREWAKDARAHGFKAIVVRIGNKIKTDFNWAVFTYPKVTSAAGIHGFSAFKKYQ